MQGNIQFGFAVNVGWLQPTFFVVLSLFQGVQISKGACKEKQSWNVDRRNSVHRPTEHTTQHNADPTKRPIFFHKNA